jgi:hypothetical protein
LTLTPVGQTISIVVDDHLIRKSRRWTAPGGGFLLSTKQRFGSFRQSLVAYN